ncbi:hypothetical protein [Streptomyces sp. NPDC058394]|uniref:hypothetical protein n=1 Tax=unclassified Streptomyces TaxID=2593676 RepID=UPI0036670143
MDHLEHCPACREHVHEPTATSDALLDLVPGSEPPVGFEDRVIDRLGFHRSVHSGARLTGGSSPQGAPAQPLSRAANQAALY